MWGWKQNAYWACWINLKEGDHSEDLGIDGKLILNVKGVGYEGVD